MSRLLNDQTAAKWLAFLFFAVIGILIAAVVKIAFGPLISRKIADMKSPEDFKEKRRNAGKDMRRFWFVWIVIFAVLAAVFIAGTVVLNIMLSEYESTQPIHKAEEIFNSYFADFDADALKEYLNYKETDFESEEAALESVKTAFADNGADADYHEVISDDGNVHKYAVTVGEYTLGYFTVATDEENSTPRFHFSYCRLDSIRINAKATQAIVIFAPQKANVYVNGVLLTEEYIEGDPIVFESADYYPDGDESWRTMVNYVVKNLYSRPEIKVAYPGTVEYTVTLDESAGKYIIEPKTSGSEETALSLKYDSEQNSYSAESSYVRMLAAAYNTAVEDETERRYTEHLKTETDAMIAAEKAEYALLLSEEEARIVSEEIKAKYESRVKLLTEKYTNFIFQSPTSSYRTATLPYIEKNTSLYSYVKSEYTNYSYYYLSSLTYSDFSSTNYKWTDDTHKAFTCEVTITVDMYGKRNGQSYPLTEVFTAKLTVSLKNSTKGLLANSENIVE